MDVVIENACFVRCLGCCGDVFESRFDVSYILSLPRALLLVLLGTVVFFLMLTSGYCISIDFISASMSFKYSSFFPLTFI